MINAFTRADKHVNLMYSENCENFTDSFHTSCNMKSVTQVSDTSTIRAPSQHKKYNVSGCEHKNWDFHDLLCPRETPKLPLHFPRLGRNTRLSRALLPVRTNAKINCSKITHSKKTLFERAPF